MVIFINGRNMPGKHYYRQAHGHELLELGRSCDQK